MPLYSGVTLLIERLVAARRDAIGHLERRHRARHIQQLKIGKHKKQQVTGHGRKRGINVIYPGTVAAHYADRKT